MTLDRLVEECRELSFNPCFGGSYIVTSLHCRSSASS